MLSTVSHDTNERKTIYGPGLLLCRHAYLAFADDRNAFLEFAQKVLLYQPPSSLLRAAPVLPAEGLIDVKSFALRAWHTPCDYHDVNASLMSVSYTYDAAVMTRHCACKAGVSLFAKGWFVKNSQGTPSIRHAGTCARALARGH